MRGWGWGAAWILAVGAAAPAPSLATGGGGCGAGECRDCHALTVAEAAGFLQGMADSVVSVAFAPVPGLFEAQVLHEGQRFPLYIDFSKSWVLQANLAPIRQGGGPTAAAPPRSYDVGPLLPGTALVVGKREAKRKVTVFTNPRCSFCVKLHPELKKAAAADPETAFFIKLLPLKTFPGSYDLCRAVTCAGTVEALEEAMAGKELVPAPGCEAGELKATIAFAKANGLSSTPTLVLPGGRVAPGFRKAEEILELLKKEGTSP